MLIVIVIKYHLSMENTINIFKEYNVNYKVEVSFDDLIGVGNKNLLRYDFAILDDYNTI